MDELEKDIEGTGNVIRINAYGGDGDAVSQKYGVYGLPTFVVFNGAGQPTYRYVGVPDKRKLLGEVSKVASPKSQ